MLHLLVDAGALDPSNGQRWLIREERLGSLELPPTIQGIVQARLDRLEPDARAALAQAAVVGRIFWRGAVDALRAADPEPRASPLDELLASLRERRLIRVREASTIAGEQELAFAESSTQEVAYGTLTARVRRPFHRAIARWLEERAKSEAGAALIAQHHDRGGDRAAAATHYARAGVHAATLGQNAQALRHFERAREIHDEAIADAEAMDPMQSTVALLDDEEDARVAT
jgi:predicted ATPase